MKVQGLITHLSLTYIKKMFTMQGIVQDKDVDETYCIFYFIFS